MKNKLPDLANFDTKDGTKSFITEQKFQEILKNRNLKLVPGKMYNLNIDDETGELIDISDPDETVN